jgi:2,4-dienoyl-CoA reductase (NADPH2)
VIDGSVKVSNSIVVIGGGEVGMETAEMLSDEGKKVTIVEMLPRIGEQMVMEAFNYISDKLEKHKVEILTSTMVNEITGNSVIVGGKDGKTRTILTDTVIIATGARPNKKVADALSCQAREVYMAGDCTVPGNIRLAIHQGNMIARTLY